MSDTLYYWCQLQRGNEHTCGYIPSRGAKIGKMVELLEYGKEFWKVTSVDKNPVTKEYIRKNEKKYEDFQKSLKGGGIK